MQLITIVKQQWHDYLYKTMRMPLWVFEDNTIWCDSEEYYLPLIAKDPNVTNPTAQVTCHLSVAGPQVIFNDNANMADIAFMEDDYVVAQARLSLDSDSDHTRLFPDIPTTTTASVATNRLSSLDMEVDNIRQTMNTLAVASEHDLQALRDIIENINDRIHDIEEYLRRSDHANDRSSENE